MQMKTEFLKNQFASSNFILQKFGFQLTSCHLPETTSREQFFWTVRSQRHYECNLNHIYSD